MLVSKRFDRIKKKEWTNAVILLDRCSPITTGPVPNGGGRGDGLGRGVSGGSVVGGVPPHC